ncbi:UNVERIFIED_CONTAM: hypothetical protein RMT77_008412 [Armadillidium vulgare]
MISRAKVIPVRAAPRNRRSILDLKSSENDRIYLYSFIRPFTSFGAIIGLFPFSKFYSKEEPGKIKFLSALSLYGLAILICFIVSVIIDLFYWILPTFKDLTQFVQLLNFFFSFLTSVTSVVCSILHFISHKSEEKVYKELKEVDDILPTTKGTVMKKLRFCSCGFLFFFCLTQALNIYFLTIDNENEQKFSFIFYTLTLIAYVFSTLYTVAVPVFILLQAAGLCLCTANLCGNLNKNLHNTLSPFRTKITEQHPDMEDKTRMIKDEEFIKELERHRSIHLKIWSFSQSVSDHLSSKLFVVLTSYFLVTCYHVYQCLTALKHKKAIEDIAVNFGTSFTNLFGVGILAWAVDVQSKKYGETVQILNSSEIPLRHNEVSSYLLRFSIQILQLRTSIDVIGFFSVNRAFLLAMISTVASYIVILLQFEDAEEAHMTTHPPKT